MSRDSLVLIMIKRITKYCAPSEFHSESFGIKAFDASELESGL